MPCSAGQVDEHPKPTHPQTVMMTTAYSAWCGDGKKP